MTSASAEASDETIVQRPPLKEAAARSTPCVHLLQVQHGLLRWEAPWDAANVPSGPSSEPPTPPTCRIMVPRRSRRSHPYCCPTWRVRRRDHRRQHRRLVSLPALRRPTAHQQHQLAAGSRHGGSTQEGPYCIVAAYRPLCCQRRPILVGLFFPMSSWNEGMLCWHRQALPACAYSLSLCRMGMHRMHGKMAGSLKHVKTASRSSTTHQLYSRTGQR